VDDHACRLVDDEKMLVLVGDPEVHLLPLERFRRFWRQLQLELLAALQAIALGSRAPVYSNRAGRQ
jgi:hypothetical protein